MGQDGRRSRLAGRLLTPLPVLPSIGSEALFPAGRPALEKSPSPS